MNGGIVIFAVELLGENGELQIFIHHQLPIEKLLAYQCGQQIPVEQHFSLNQVIKHIQYFKEMLFSKEIAVQQL